MAKVMLVEDDNNLIEIYEARLAAEGFEIVTAHDGEEALATAVKERPDLIIADVMMPKISGFDMLDILRSTAETKNTKVVMMTALSQIEDKERADKLGADRYLVKSQVTLEDVVRTAHEVLEDDTAGPSNKPADTTTTPPAPSTGSTTPADTPGVPTPTVTTIPVAQAPEPTQVTQDSAIPTPPEPPKADQTTAPVPEPPKPADPVVPEPTAPVPSPVPEPVQDTTPTTTAPVADPVTAPVPPTPEPAKDTAPDITVPTPQPTASIPTPDPAPPAEPTRPDVQPMNPQDDTVTTAPLGDNPHKTKVLQPVSDSLQSGPNLEELLAKEEAKDPTPAPQADTPNQPHVPGQTIHPDGTDPSKISL